jgi:hypothetical protein
MKTETSKKPEYLIDTTSVQDSFEKELNQYDGSARIFFSGKYGVGKTKFLERFFDVNKDKYLRIHLFPVNYQIYNNLDIIELLKADIIIELLKQNINFQNNSELTLYEYLKQYANLPFLLQKGLEYGKELVPTEYRGVLNILGKSLQDGQKLAGSFHKAKKGDSGVIGQFLDESKEPDIISSIVHKTIKGIDDKKSGLIIDDLDRLDPEHIFRILNVLSAHFDQDGDNKFGFDYIIIVGDYNNIQSIFHHKYGEDADFDGYIDKFYTGIPFEFDNRKVLLSQLPDIIKAYQREDSPKSDSNYTYIIVEDILRKSVDSEFMNLRQLLKNIHFKLSPTEDKYINIPIDLHQMVIAIDILISIFGDSKQLLQIIKKIKGVRIPPGAHYQFPEQCRSIITKVYPVIMGEKLEDKPFFTYLDRTYSLRLDEDINVESKKVVIMNSQTQSNKDYLDLYYDLLSKYIETQLSEYTKV